MSLSIFMGALALALQSAPATTPELSLEQRTSLRCAAAFAIVADGQANGNPAAQAWPALGERGKEFFVRASAQVMDQAGLDRGQISAILSAEAQKLWDEGTIDDVMPGCLLLLDASGI